MSCDLSLDDMLPRSSKTKDDSFLRVSTRPPMHCRDQQFEGNLGVDLSSLHLKASRIRSLLSDSFEAKEISMDWDIEGCVRDCVGDMDLDCRLFPMRTNDQRFSISLPPSEIDHELFTSKAEETKECIFVSHFISIRTISSCALMSISYGLGFVLSRSKLALDLFKSFLQNLKNVMD